MRTFFISDMHFGHANIMKYSNRPFKTVEEMDSTIIKNWNEKVTNNDRVFILGDICMDRSSETVDKIMPKLNGQKFLIKGNHDYFLDNKSTLKYFGWVKDHYKLNINGHKVVLFHYPILDWDCKFHGAVHCYGHIHNNTTFDIGLAYNVGVDVNDFKPISWEEICEKLKIPPIYQK